MGGKRFSFYQFRKKNYPPINAPREALDDTEIIKRFAEKMSFGESFNYLNNSKIYDKHVLSTKGTNIDISGLNYEYLKENRSFQWGKQAPPRPRRGSFRFQNVERIIGRKSSPFGGVGVGAVATGASRLFTDHKFYTPNQRAKIHAVPDENLSEKLNEDFPLILTTGRIRDQWHTMTKMGKVNKLNQHIAQPYVEIHPKDAERREIKEGQKS